jgi:hypothetical protein
LRAIDLGFILSTVMIRIFITAWLSLLLVGMQQQLVVHEVDHLRAKVQRGHDVGLERPGSAECIECALLSAGSSAVPIADISSSYDARTLAPVAAIIAAGQPQAKPSFYQSRGPPAVL